MGRKKFSIKKRWLKKIEKNNVRIVLNILYAKKEKIYPAYVSKHYLNCGKQVIFLMISNRDNSEAKFEGRWYYLAVKKIISIIKRKNF